MSRGAALLSAALAATVSSAIACSAARSNDGAEAGSDAAGEDARLPVDASRDVATKDAGSPPPRDAARDSKGGADGGLEAATRDPFQQPFASTSIWNMPIGESATYVPAKIQATTGTTLETDDDVLVLMPTAPDTQIFTNTADWNPALSRCAQEGPLLFSAPMPASWVVPDPMAQTPNSGLAALLADGRTVKQTQPFARCTADQPATSHYLFPDVDLYGAGIPGAHGGSGLSAIGGTLRLGELRPKGSPPRHALKLELFAAENYYNDGKEADCFHWPATACDGYFDTTGSSLKYGGTNPALGPGSLLAIPPSVSIASLGLTTLPAQALAWTLQNYGAYLVDDTAWSAVAICVENGAAGSFEDQFQADWGFPISTGGTTGAFAEDIAAITKALEVVTNNSATSIGGGGTPREPLAPELTPPDGGGD